MRELATVLPELLLAMVPLTVIALVPPIATARAVVSSDARYKLPEIVVEPLFVTVSLRLLEPIFATLPVKSMLLLPLIVTSALKTTALAIERAAPPAWSVDVLLIVQVLLPNALLFAKITVSPVASTDALPNVLVPPSWTMPPPFRLRLMALPPIAPLMINEPVPVW